MVNDQTSMKKTTTTLCYSLLILIAIVLLSTNRLVAQYSGYHNICLRIPELALIDIEPNTNPISLSIVAPREAGEPASSSTDATKWLNCSSSLRSGAASRSILAQLQNSPPSGLSLMLEASNYSGNGAGAMGSSTGAISLTIAPQTIISGIGRGFTGNGANNGYQLNFSLSINNYQLLDANDTRSVTVIYTITD